MAVLTNDRVREVIPAAPRLHPRCQIIPDPPGVVLRRGRMSLRVNDEPRTERLMTMLSVLDGRTIEAAVSALGIQFLRDTLQILEGLHSAGMLIENGEGRATGLLSETPPLHPLTDALAVIGTGAAADDLRVELSRAGALGDNTNARLSIVCPNGPDLTTLEAFNEDARKDRRPWMPAFRLGDDLIAGPVFEPSRPGCFRCFVLRWLGMARSIQSEKAYFRWLRGGGWRQEIDTPEERAILVHYAIRAASAWLSGSLEQDRITFVDLQTGHKTTPRLVPHPDCEICTGSWAKPSPAMWTNWRSAGAAPPVEDMADRLESVVDDRIGLVGPVETVALPSSSVGGAPLVATTAPFALPCVEKLTSDSTAISSGLDVSDRRARLLAIVEGLERYCGQFSRAPDVVAAYRDLAASAILPTDLPLFSDAQYRQQDFPFRPFSPEEHLSWMWGYSLTHDRPRLVPRSAVTYGPTDDKLVDESSSGVAAGTSAVDAALRALLEMVERDAFMVFWLNRLSPPVLDCESLPAGFTRSAVSEIRGLGHEPFAVNVTTDLGIPVFLGGAVRTDGRYPALVLGAGCAFDPQEALDKAFRELLGALRWDHVDPTWTLRRVKRPDEVKRLDDHHIAYSHPQWLRRAQFLWSSARRQRFGSFAAGARPPALRPGEQLAEAVDMLLRCSLEVIVVDLTTPDVAETGIRVIRAVIPGLQPMGFGQHAARLGGRRVYQAACRMGYRSRPLAEHRLNRDPHCFP